MKKRKLLALLLGMVMVLSLAFLTACGNGDDDPADDPDVEENGDNGEDDNEPEPDGEDNGDESDGDTGDAQFGGENFMLWIDNEDYAIALVAALSERFPNSSFDYEIVGGTDTVEDLALAGPGGHGADIILFPHDQLAGAANQGLLLPLGPDIGAAMQGRVPEFAIGTVQHDGHYLGVPLRMESVALFYNRTLLEENGLEVATTWEEIIDQAGEYNDVANSDFLIRWEPGNAFFSHFILTAHGFELFGPDHNDPDLVNLNSAEVIAGLEFLEGLREILPVPADDLNWDTVHGAFVGGEVPYVITGPWSIPYIMSDSDGFEWGVKTIPTINGVQPTTFSGYHIAAGSSFTDYSDLTRAVLEFMMSDEGLQMVYDEIGVMPALIDESIVNGLADDLFLLGVAAQMEHTHPMPGIPEMSQYWDSADAMLASVWEGLATPEEAAANAEETFDAGRALADQ